jgi:hypothetical protein
MRLDTYFVEVWRLDARRALFLASKVVKASLKSFSHMLHMMFRARDLQLQPWPSKFICEPVLGFSWWYDIVQRSLA